MKLWLTILVVTLKLYSFEVKTSFNPESPVKGEPFQVIFEVQSEKGGEPLISFDPLGVEVLGKDNLGSSTRTTYINGKLSTSRKTTVAYKLLASRNGTIYLRNIKVSLGAEEKKLKTLSKIVLLEPARPRRIFALAEVEKNEAFVNESIMVRYYLYNKVNVTTTDIIKFPALDKFMKRFHQEKQRPERVRYNGDIYVRRIIYTAQLFAKEPGEYKIDPIIMNVNYTDRTVDPFDNLGFGGGFGRRKSLEVRSKPVKVKIKKLPIQNVPGNFTGLVGKHDFNLKINKNKFVVNEPIELKLIVNGEGALELFDKPVILKDPSIEEFEVSTDLQIGQDFSATKTFDYTYLGRQSLKLDSDIISLSYFDPDELKFKNIELKLPQIEIAGGVQAKTYAKNNEGDSEGLEPSEDKANTELISKIDYFSPMYKITNTYKYNAKKIALILVLIVIIILIIRFRPVIKNMLIKKTSDDIYSRAVHNGLSYAELYELISKLGSGQDMLSIIENSIQDTSLRKYLEKQITQQEESYRKGKKIKTKLNKSMMKEIKALIENEYEWN
jgi:hypothetical protein